MEKNAKLEPIVSIKGLDVVYDMGKTSQVHALDDVSLDIYPGEFIILFGPSGCGKSTLLYCIAGLEKRINKGEIVSGGKNVARMDPKEIEFYRQKQVGMIFQAFYLIGSLTILKNVVLPQMAIGSSPRDRTKKAKGLLEHFGVGDQSSKVPNQLSGGQQQRVAICRALVNDPEILLADEPVGNLDSKSADEVLKLMKDLNEKQNKTIIFVTHNPAHINIAHRIYYMKDGKIIDAKINKSVAPGIGEEIEESMTSQSRDIELLAKTYSDIKSQKSRALLVSYKAKEIVSEVLTGLSTEDISSIEERVINILGKGEDGLDKLKEYLDKSKESGGLGLDKRTAENLSEKILGISKEIRVLVRKEEKAERQSETSIPSEAFELRRYLFEFFNLEINQDEILTIINDILRKRLANEVDRRGVLDVLDKPFSSGGAGFDRRVARKFAKRLELIILGKVKI